MVYYLKKCLICFLSKKALNKLAKIFVSFPDISLNLSDKIPTFLKLFYEAKVEFHARTLHIPVTCSCYSLTVPGVQNVYLLLSLELNFYFQHFAELTAHNFTRQVIWKYAESTTHRSNVQGMQGTHFLSNPCLSRNEEWGVHKPTKMWFAITGPWTGVGSGVPRLKITNLSCTDLSIRGRKCHLTTCGAGGVSITNEVGKNIWWKRKKCGMVKTQIISTQVTDTTAHVWSAQF